MNLCTQIEELTSWHLSVQIACSFRGCLSFLHKAFKSAIAFILFYGQKYVFDYLQLAAANCNAKRENKVSFIFDIYFSDVLFWIASHKLMC